MNALAPAALSLALLALLSNGAQAASPIDADVRCLAISDRLAQSSDAKAKETGKVAQIFFLGRVNAGPGAPVSVSVLSAAMVDAARRLTGDFAKAEATRCSGVMKSAFTLLETAGPMANRTLQAGRPAGAR